MKKKLLWWILIFLWCCFIFYQSGKPALDSEKESTSIAIMLNHLFKLILGSGIAEIPDNVIRKSAHFFEYLILGLLFYKGYFIRRKQNKTFLISSMSGVLYSITDEIHQFFVQGRAMRAFDVMIDSIGIFTGVCLMFLYSRRKEKKST